MKKWLIYKVTSPNNKIYIGQTYKDLNIRKSEHIKESVKIVYKDNGFKRAILKYGDSLIWEVIEDNILTLEESHEKEIFYILQFDSANSNKGYNSTLGGAGVIPTQEIKDKISISVTEANLKRFEDPDQLVRQQEIMKVQSTNPLRIPNLKAARSSSESRKKTSNDNLKRYSDPKNKDIMSIACGGKPFSVYKENVFIGDWVSQKQCARDLFQKESTAKYIGYCVNKKRSSYRGYIFVVS